MGFHHPSNLFVGVIGIGNVAHAHSACRYIAEAEGIKRIERSRGARRERRHVDRSQALDSLQDAFAQCDFLDILVFDDFLVDGEESLFKFKMVVEEFIFCPPVI